MDIKPIDVQMFINKSYQINKNDNHEQKGAEQFQLFSDNFLKSNQQQEKRTIETNKSEEQNITRDKKDNSKNNNKNKKNKSSKDKQNNKSSKNNSVSLFNVSI